MEGGSTVVNLEEGEREVVNLPPGFRFHPTDEEIITHYLTHKFVSPNFTAIAIGEADLNKCEPWDLPKKAKMGEKEWFFFCQRDRKYPTGMRTNRATEIGYWKATGKDKEIYRKRLLVGMKKTLVFYKGRAPKGEKSNWVMHEFRLDGQLSYQNFPNKSSVAKDEWVVCKVFHKSGATINNKDSVTDLTRMNSFVEGILGSPSLPPVLDSPHRIKTITTTTNHQQDSKGTIVYHAPSFSDGKFSNQMQQHCYMTLNPSSTNYQSSQISTNYKDYDHTTSSSSSMFYSQNANLPYHDSSSLGNYFLHQQRLNSSNIASNRECKVEQYSSNLSRSQDTGISTHDVTAPEISSKQQVVLVERNKPTSYNEDAVKGTSVGHLDEDFDSFWNFQV